MTGLHRDDIRAAVGAGMITEAQAASLIILAEQRSGARRHLTGLDEPFDLFRGFNEVFIVIGLGILFAGWIGVTELGIGNIGSSYLGSSNLGALALAAVTMGLCALLARYFTLTRRMIAPSIALSIFFGLAAVQFGGALAATLGGDTRGWVVIVAGVCAVLSVAYYALFRVPFTVAQIAVAVFVAVFGAAALDGSVPESPKDVFLLSADGPFAVLTILLGLMALGVALTFDMSDPHRVTRRAASGFWLHVIAAPAIVNTVALTLFEAGTVAAQLVLVAFLAAIAFFAIVIDRRSFLVAGVGYVVALAFTVIEGQPFVAVLLLGVVLVVLGARWERLRRAIMRALPDFPGKDRLPPWDLLQTRKPVS